MEDRIEMLKALSITDADARRAMRLLGKIRNNLVHNVQQIDFQFSTYLKSRDNRKNFVESFGTEWPDPIPGDAPVSRADYVVQNPRYAIWTSLMRIVVLTATTKMEAERAKAIDALRREMLVKTLRETKGTNRGDKPPSTDADTA